MQVTGPLPITEWIITMDKQFKNASTIATAIRCDTQLCKRMSVSAVRTGCRTINTGKLLKGNAGQRAGETHADQDAADIGEIVCMIWVRQQQAIIILAALWTQVTEQYPKIGWKVRMNKLFYVASTIATVLRSDTQPCKLMFVFAVQTGWNTINMGKLLKGNAMWHAEEIHADQDAADIGEIAFMTWVSTLLSTQ